MKEMIFGYLRNFVTPDMINSFSMNAERIIVFVLLTACIIGVVVLVMSVLVLKPRGESYKPENNSNCSCVHSGRVYKPSKKFWRSVDEIIASADVLA